MHQVVCATTNPAKIQAILQAFHEIFGEGSCHIASVAVESGVPEQPFGSEETRAGARNRVANARRLLPEADFWVAGRIRRLRRIRHEQCVRCQQSAPPGNP
ncbi:DUF84 family protein, partial [Escherichia coli]